MAKKSESQNMVTVQRAAAERGVTPARIYQWIEEGRIKNTKIDEIFNRRLVDLNEVLSLEPMKPGPKPQEEAEKSVAKKRARKKDPTRLLKTLSLKVTTDER